MDQEPREKTTNQPDGVKGHNSKKNSKLTYLRLPTLALKHRGDVTRSPKQGYQWPNKKDSCPPKFFLKQLTYLDQ